MEFYKLQENAKTATGSFCDLEKSEACGVFDPTSFWFWVYCLTAPPPKVDSSYAQVSISLHGDLIPFTTSATTSASTVTDLNHPGRRQ